MTIRMAMISLAALTVCGCNEASQTPATNEILSTANDTQPAALPSPAENTQSNVALPDDRTPLEEPRGSIDPKSAEAAGQVVQHYGALIEQGRWSEAKTFWGDGDTADRFRGELSKYSEVHMEIGKPGDSEGAAGSIYITVPVIFYGRTDASQALRRAANVILRRVNDVPGSTAAQRRWHIEHVEWRDGG